MENKKKHAGGRPTLMTEKQIELLESLCRMKPTLDDCAEILKVEPSTIEKWIKRTHGISFSAFRDKRMVHTRFMITRNIIQECQKGNTTMLIYASKNLCGWSDKQEVEHSGQINSSVTVNLNFPRNGKEVE